MSELNSAEKHNTERAQFAVEAPIIISQDDAREGPTDHKVLYVLGFGIAGAILANMTVFLYFVSFHASG
jgi:hypothetical protein